MNYTRRIDTDKAVEMQISSFTGKGGTTEYQVMVSITDPCLSFVEQLQNLLRVYVTVVKEELSNDEWNNDRYVDLFANGDVGTNVRFRFTGSVA